MFKQVLGWVVVLILAFAVIGWLGEGNNGKEAGRMAGDTAEMGKDGIGGALDALEGFIRGLTG